MPDTTYVVYLVTSADDGCLQRLGQAVGSTQAALRAVWKSLDPDDRPGPDAEYVVIPARSIHSLKPKVIEEPQLRFST